MGTGLVFEVWGCTTGLLSLAGHGSEGQKKKEEEKKVIISAFSTLEEMPMQKGQSDDEMMP